MADTLSPRPDGQLPHPDAQSPNPSVFFSPDPNPGHFSPNPNNAPTPNPNLLSPNPNAAFSPRPDSLVPLSQPATIRIAEDTHPKELRLSESDSRCRPLTRTDTTALAGGIYSTRALSRVTTQRSISLDRHRTEAFEEEGDNWRENEKPKVKQIYKGTTLLWLAYQSIGAIYGDVGTSPLYVFSSTFTKDPTRDDVIMVLSLVLWSMSIMVTLKYVFIILRADNEGEGGTFSCYSLLTRFAHLTERDPREAPLIHMERHLTGNLRPVNGKIRSAIENSKFFRGLLKTIGVLAVSMVLSDGVLTPAQSILGAVQGLNVVKPDIDTSTVVGTTCGIIVLLFAIQPLGLSRLASVFAPIVILWLGFNGGFGIYNLVKYDHSVLKAFNPYWAFRFFIVNKTEGWKMLGGVLLAFTGVEALFADLGAFSMRAIQLSWMCYTYPCLLLAYTGQAAFLAVHPTAWTNPFYNSVPPGMLYPSLVVAVLAAIVASQAIITATFQLISQIMKLSYCPQVKVVHTSKTFHGQLYVPFLNWLLMIGTILVTAIYSNTTRLGNAYGVCVMFVTFFDTCMVTLVALIVWRVRPWMVILPWLFFALHDALYLSSALNKVPDGAWFTLTLSAILASLFLLWRYGKESQWSAEAEDRFKLNNLVMKDPTDGKLHLTPKWGGDMLSQIRGLGIFFDKTGVMTPSVFTQFASKFVAVMDVTVFFHLHPVEAPTVPDEERYSVSKFTTIPGCYRLVVKHGYMDEVISPDLAALIYEKVRAFIIRQASDGFALPDESEEETNSNYNNNNNNDNHGRNNDVKNSGVGAHSLEMSAIENIEGHGESDSQAQTQTGDSPSSATTTSADVLKGGGAGERAGAPLSQSPTTTAAAPEEAEAGAGDDGVPAAAPPHTPAISFTLAATNHHSHNHSAFSPRPPHYQHHTEKQRPIELRDEQVAAELARLDRAYAAKIMYIVGKGQMKIRSETKLFRRGILSLFLWIRENTRGKIANLRLAHERVMEVGFVKEI